MKVSRHSTQEEEEEEEENQQAADSARQTEQAERAARQTQQAQRAARAHMHALANKALQQRDAVRRKQEAHVEKIAQCLRSPVRCTKGFPAGPTGTSCMV